MTTLQLTATFTADATVLRLCAGCGERFPADQLNEHNFCAGCAAEHKEQP